MENIVLYRKYRPQNFSDIIGQEHVVQTLTNAIRAKSVSHAYLFAGPRGSGKTTIARIFAKAINCEDIKGMEPCNKCGSCLEINGGNSLDLAEIDAASHTGVDEVRTLIEGLRFAPVKSKCKIFIIDECHQLSKSAANALLKTLEEPPAHAIFILATTEAHKMIPTIVSRCQRFDFRRLQSSEVIKKLEFILKKEQIKCEPAALHLIAFSARGSFRDAESLLDKCISFTAQDKLVTLEEVKDLLGIVEVIEVSRLLDFLMARNAKEAIRHVNSLAEQGTDLQEFAKTLVFYVRQAMLLKVSSDLVHKDSSGFSAEEMEQLRKQVETLAGKEIQNMLELFIEAENKMKYATIPQLPLELAIVEITYKEV